MSDDTGPADTLAAGLDRVADWVRGAGPASLTVLTGAGLSTDSGIPDFRGPSGVWTTDPSAMATVSIDAYLSDRAVRVRAWADRRAHAAWDAEPNAGHRALVRLERAGWLRSIVTQNIDGLHAMAGSSPDLVREIHGTIWRVVCLACGDRRPMAEALARVDAGEADPACSLCGGILKSDTISFGQSLDPGVLAASIRDARECAVLLTAGTSLQVHPAAGLCDHAVGAAARLVVLNDAPTAYDPMADAVLRAPVGVALPGLADRLT